MDDESALALEEAVMRLPDPTESDEDSPDTMTVIDEKDRDEDEMMNGNGHPLPRHYPSGRFPQSGGGGGSVDKSPRLTLRRVLDSDKDFALFRQFLKDQCITRNLNFWLACEGYRDGDPDNRTESAKAIYTKFLKSTAPMHVSILPLTRRKIHLGLQLGRAEQDLFDSAQEEVLQMMEQNELRQFLYSDSMADRISQTDSDTHYMGGLHPKFLPATYGGGSLQSGSDDSTSYTSAESDQVSRTQVLCVPPHTRHHHYNHHYNRPHSDTEYSSKSYNHGNAAAPMIHFNSRRMSRHPSQFYDILYKRLLNVQRERNVLKKKASNIAREAGKTYEEIMSQEWYDAPEVCKYVQFDETSFSTQMNDSPLQNKRAQSHIVSQAAHEVEEAMKDLDITRQVSMKMNSVSSLHSSSASSYISDSGVGESWLPNSTHSLIPSDDMAVDGRVYKYVQKQQELTSSLSHRDNQARVAAMMFVNNSTYSDELNPVRQGRMLPNFRRQAYSGDDSSSCFTATSQSSSEYFVPRRAPPNVYTDSGSPQQPQRPFRKMYHPRKSRFPPQQQSLQASRAISPAVPLQQQQQQQLPPPPPPAATAPGTHSSSRENSLLVVYTMDGQTAPAPFAKRVPGRELTLSEFKDKVFARKGNYRFFFKSYDDGLELMEEKTEESEVLPVYSGKIVGHVERIECAQT